LDAVRALLVQGAFETDRFDFKLTLPRSADDVGRDRLRGVAASFANTSGGFIVLGVDDDRSQSVEQRLVGIAATEDVPERFGGLLHAIEPSVPWQHKNPPLRLDTGSVIHVIHVPRSRSAPHGIERDGRWRFPKRTNRGTEAMSLIEMRAAFVDHRARVAAVRLIDGEVARIASLAERHNRDSQRARTALPETLYLELYRTGALDSKLSFVFEEVTEQSTTCFRSSRS
jgi:predicted HTH transcriptional regulator